MPAIRIPTSFTAGRRIALGEVQAALAPPVLTKGATAGVGGTFTAGSVFWAITSVDLDGESLASAEVTTVMTATSTQDFTWAAVPGVTGYKLYRGTATGVYTKRVVSLGLVTAYTDLGNPGTAASPPIVDTTGGVKFYETGDNIPVASLRKIRNLSSLLSRRWIIPNMDLHYRKTKPRTPTPTDLSPASVRKAL